MSNWNGGYVTDIAYTANFHPEAAPHNAILASLLAGYAAPQRHRPDGLHVLELGCGRGIDALLVAAGNPGWRVTGIDFMPGAIADARELAADAGLANIDFIEADLADFIDTPAGQALPPVDLVNIHGVWSWVPAPVRAGILRLLAARLVAGGIVHLSYNVLPGLQGALALQRVMLEVGRTIPARSDAQALAGLAAVRDLHAAEAANLTLPVVERLLKSFDTLPAEYLAHEYMNAVWQPFFHADVRDMMATAKLDHVASGRLLENFQDLILTASQKAVVERLGTDPRLRETLIDTCAQTSFRNDIYIRGARRLSAAQSHAELCKVTLALAGPAEGFIYSLNVKAGQAALGRGFYEPIVAALAEAPRSVGELLRIGGAAPGEGNPAELIGILVGTKQALYLPWPDAAPDAALARFNRALAYRIVDPERLEQTATMAGARSGGGIVARVGELFLLERLMATGGAVDPGVWAAEIGGNLPPEAFAQLRETFARALQERLPVWRHAGAV